MHEAIDYGTEQRYQHGCVDLAGKDGKELDPDGMRVVHAKERHECIMDVLKERGRLGDEKATNRRYDAAMWLRGCYTKAGLEPRTVGALEQTSLGKHTLSEAQDWNRRCYREAMRAMGPKYALTVERVAVHSAPCGRLDIICDGLDRLAEHRGID